MKSVLFNTTAQTTFLSALQRGIRSLSKQTKHLLRITLTLAVATLMFGGNVSYAEQSNAPGVNKQRAKAVTTPAAKTIRAAADNFTGNGWYYNPNQSGTGFMYEAQGDTGFVAFFMYTDAGAAIWYAASGAFTQVAGGHQFTGMLKSYRGGQAAGSSIYTAPTSTDVGNVSIAFSGGNATATLPGGRVMSAVRFNFNDVTKPAFGRQSELGWYWNATQGGRGYAIEVQTNKMFMAMFHYNGDGSPTWNTATADVTASGAFSNADFITYSGGQSLTSAYRAPTGSTAQGKVSATFTDACTGLMSLPGNNSVNVSRFAFGVSNACRSASASAQKGVLTDAPVQGVAYRTSSGLSGVTGSNGEYSFNPGDTVEFRLGALSLGTVKAYGIISPILLAGNDANKLTNLLVLLQSLDTDGNPANGIVVDSRSADAMSGAVNLSQSPQAFASSANAPLVASMSAAGINRAVVSTSAANAHFQSQGLAQLSENVLVMYSTTEAVMVRVMPDGSYMIGTAEPDNYCGANGQCGTTLISRAGIEFGSLRVIGFNTSGYQITATVTFDSNLQGGLSHPAACDSGFLPVGDGWISNGTCADSGDLIAKAPNDPNGILGVWAIGANTLLTPHIAFFPNGKFLLVHPTGDTSAPGCGAKGLEFGNYTYNSTTKVLTHTGLTYDTNGCAGLSSTFQGQTTFNIDAGGLTGRLNGNDSFGPWSNPVYRVSK